MILKFSSWIVLTIGLVYTPNTLFIPFSGNSFVTPVEIIIIVKIIMIILSAPTAEHRKVHCTCHKSWSPGWLKISIIYCRHWWMSACFFCIHFTYCVGLPVQRGCHTTSPYQHDFLLKTITMSLVSSLVSFTFRSRWFLPDHHPSLILQNIIIFLTWSYTESLRCTGCSFSHDEWKY